MAPTGPAQQPLGGSTIGMNHSIKYPGAFSGLSISPYGRDVVLAGRAGLAVVDLDHPLSPVRTIPIESAWKISGVAWCPSVAHHGWVATAINQTLLVHDLGSTSSMPMRALRAHPMGITDIAWAPQAPAWIGTASIDPIIKIWDVRRDQKPVWYFSKWEPADKIAFNNVHKHKLASAHRNCIAVWDIRFGSAPLMTLDDAHADDITSISWHPTQENTIVSASQDHTVKRWHVEFSHPTEEYAHQFAHEVAAAEYLPFGEALLVTQRSPDNSMVVIRDDPELTIVHQFAGLTSAVLGSAWRSRCDAHRTRHQLVTWERDQIMRMWAVGDNMVTAAGGAVLACEMPATVPSFVTNFLQPEQLLHLLNQKSLDSDLLLAATSNGGGATTWHELVRTGELSRSRSAGVQSERRVLARAAVAAAAAAMPPRTGTTDEHSSDDDDDDDASHDSGGGRDAAPAAWRKEVESVVCNRYGQSGTAVLRDASAPGRFCRLHIGIPWITNDVVELGVSFPSRYPHAALRIAVDATAAVFGPPTAIADRAAEVADACAEQGVPALDRCLYAMLTVLVAAARTHKAHAEGDRAEDLERMPLPPTPLQAVAKRSRHSSMAARLFGNAPTDVTLSSDGSRSDGDRVDPRFDRDNGSLYSDEIDEAGDEDDEFYALGYDDGAGLFGSDSSQAEGAVEPDDGLRRATHDRNRSRVPFPRLCGAVFGGPGQLVCFFASIYPADKYPGLGGAGQHQAAGRDRSREDMLQQLHQQVKPRMYRKLEYYQGIVQFGSQTSGTYLAYAGTAGPLAIGGGMGDSDDERNERQDVEVPRYYFRQQIMRPAMPGSSELPENPTYFRPSVLARADAGIGNMAMVCSGIGSQAASRHLARQFVLSGRSAEWICYQNARVAAFNNLQHLAHVWSLLACVLSPVSTTSAGEAFEHSMWLAHTPVVHWLRTEMDRYERRGDMQTLALIACVISKAVAEAAASRDRDDGGDANDLPPWMARPAATKVNPLTAAVTAHRASNRNVSFRLPSSSGASLRPPGLQSQPPPPPPPPALPQQPQDQQQQQRLAMAKITPGDDAPHIEASGHGTQLGAGSQSTATPLASGVATRVPPSDSEPDSPELLKELDSDEIKLNELMMAEGVEDTKAPSRVPSPSALEQLSADASYHEGASGRAEADAGAQHRSASDRADERSPAGPDGSENLWRRLRTNVFSRVHTVGGIGTKSPDGSSADVTGASSEPLADLLGTVGRHNSLNHDHATDVRERSATRQPLEEAQMWAALQQPEDGRRGRRGMAGHLEGNEQAYMRVKKEYARPHTRMVIREMSASMEMWAQAPHHDNWKLLYARILFRWDMDVKAVEVLKCMQDSRFHEMYYEMYCQPSMPRHDNLPRVGNPVLAMKRRGRKRAPGSAVRGGDGDAKIRRRQLGRQQQKQQLGPDEGPSSAVQQIDGKRRSNSSGDDGVGEIETGAPWLSCSWCHEYVHGRALICHACGHGGHQEHMLRWFRIVRKHLMRIGLTPAQYVQCTSVGSASTASLHRDSTGHMDGEPSTLTSAVPSVVTAGDLVRSFANSPAMAPESMPGSSSERLSMLPESLMAEVHTDDADNIRNGLHIRMHGPSSLSRQLSQESQRPELCDSSDNDSDNESNDSLNAKASRMSIVTEFEQAFLPESYGWESSDIDSDDHMRPTQGVMLRRELRAVRDTDQELIDCEHDDAARIMQKGIPTCPTGCGCNCLYESYRLIF
ncbi:hypothetical protein LPJ61_002872 [Coemansia biformis]|uniref:WD40 repeat-like protein n=1 Tax=Coemansia biformis TaxID=1286918 RepID=A0A9W7YE50_9FUNG|nr:hypothetical protein LPJ61_002872 [Coemansia biformis]